MKRVNNILNNIHKMLVERICDYAYEGNRPKVREFTKTLSTCIEDLVTHVDNLETALEAKMNINDLIKLLAEYEYGSIDIRYGVIRGWSAAHGWHIGDAVTALKEAGMNTDSYKMNATYCGVVQKGE